MQSFLTLDECAVGTEYVAALKPCIIRGGFNHGKSRGITRAPHSKSGLENRGFVGVN